MDVSLLLFARVAAFFVALETRQFLFDSEVVSLDLPQPKEYVPDLLCAVEIRITSRLRLINTVSISLHSGNVTLGNPLHGLSIDSMTTLLVFTPHPDILDSLFLHRRLTKLVIISSCYLHEPTLPTAVAKSTDLTG